MNIVADTISPVITEMNGKPISGRGYNRFLLMFNALMKEAIDSL